jgi:tetratricopeptide (TPR) repeat protein
MLLGLGKRCFTKTQVAGETREYLKLIERTPNDKRLHLKLADSYLKTGKNEEAIEEYLKVAELYVKEDFNFPAISLYKKVLSIDPKFTEAFDKMAKLYLKEGLVGSARKCYQGILRISPDSPRALKALERIESELVPDSFDTFSLQRMVPEKELVS